MDDFDSATFSIESEPDRKRVSLDDVILPTVRRSAIQIVSLSPRRQSKRPVPLTAISADNSTMQVTKLVLKTPPGSPKRQPKTPGIIIKSIQTLAGPSLTGDGNLERDSVAGKTNSVLTEKRNMPIPGSDDPASYRIIPILSPQNKDIRKEFEVRRSERERATNDFQDFLRESFKENKTPPLTPPPLSSVPAPSSAIEVFRISDKGSSDADSTSVSVKQHKSTGKTGIQKAPKQEIKAINYETQHAVTEVQYNASTQQATADQHTLLMATQNQPQTVQPSNEMITTKSINPSQGETIGNSIIVHPPKSVSQESHVTVELAKPPPSYTMRPKPASKHVSSTTKTAVVEDQKKKEKSYDAAKAREFIKEQQAKRRLEKKEAPVGSGGSSVEKDLIKQRLETLRQSSQKLVSKNLQKARKRSVSCAPKDSANVNKQATACKIKGPTSVQCNDRPSSIRSVTGLRKFASTPTLRLIKREKDPPDMKPANAPKLKEISLKAKESLPHVPKPTPADSRASDVRIGKDSSSGKSANPSTASTISKSSLKIGILRKPDNLTLDDIAQQSPLKVSQAASIPPSKPKVNAQLIVINADQDIAEPTKEAEKELKLQVPDVMLVPTNASTLPVEQQQDSIVVPSKVEENSTPVIPQSLPVKSIPPWLKQSLRQPDPYPFILAVRKKLEAVQSVREEKNKPTNNQEQKIMQPMSSSRYNSYLNEIESVPFIRKKPVIHDRHAGENVLNKRQFSTAHDEGSSIVTKISPCASPNTTSEISSIKSDIALPLPPLLSSTKIEIPIESYCPTKTSGAISPLSVDRISQMKIATPEGSNIRTPHHSVEIKSVEIRNDGKTGTSSPPRPHVVVQQSLNMSHMDRSQKELEYQRLLESFNRSLTHVIEVNQQLYSALKNVPTATAIPPFPQDVIRIRDEMTQTSQAIPRIAVAAVTEKVDTDQQSGKVSEATTTTASNYSDDFEHQSQTEVPPPPEQTPHDTVATSSASSTTTSSSSTSSSSSSANSSAGSETGDTNTKSSSQSLTSSSFNNDRVVSPRSVQNRPETNATDDERKATSNTTTAHSSDFDSRSFSLSDSHNNTTNNHPPMPEEYLPSFEESLRRKQLPIDKPQQELNGQRKEQQNEHTFEHKEVTQESSISEEIQPSLGEARSFSIKHSENANDLKLNSVPLVTSSSEESIMKNDSQTKTNKESLIYMENADATINSDLLTAMFNRTDLEVSILSTTVSETNLSYSSIGMFDQLIQTERSKEDHLVSRVHSKQKALLNRAKGQLAWLELQKQRYREKGMTDQITAVKKKQRAILLRLQKDRAELNRALKSSTESSRTMTGNDPVLTSKMVDSKLNSYCSSPVANHSGSLTLRKSSSNIRIARHQHSRTPESPNRRLAGTTTTTTSNSIQIAIRGRELEPNDRLEDILLRREEELRKRKEHVQRLLEWHRKLEREEEELIAVEDRLLAYNTRKLEPANTSRQEMTIEERVQRIEKSIRTLQSIPTIVARRDDGTFVTPEHEGRSSVTGVKESESEEEIVLTGGSKLNKFWYRLTGIEEQRYEPGRNYPITRLHMEALFEDAKRCVLKRFQRNDGHLQETLLEQSIKIIPRKGNETDVNTTGSVEDTASMQSTAVAEVTVRTVEQLEEKEIISEDTPHDTVTIITNATANTEQTEGVGQEEPDAMSNELPPMEGEDEKCLLSSTVNAWSPGSRKSIESVEFHTLEETTTQYQSTVGIEQDVTMEEEPIKSESYSITFEDQSVGNVEAGEESQQLIEDMSLPPMLLNNTSLKIDGEDSATSSSCESSATVELSVPLATEEKVLEEIPNQDGNDLDTISSDASISIAQSLEEASDSSSISNGTTPTTVTPTMTIETIDNNDVFSSHLCQGDDTEDDVKGISSPKNPMITLETPESSYEEDIFHTKSSSVSGSAHGTASELAKRLATLHDELEELSETLERTPLMKSPVTAASLATKADQSEDQNSSEETITFDFDEEAAGIVSPSTDLTKDEDGKPSNDATVNQNSAKIEVKLRSKVMGSSDTIAIVSGSNSVYNRDYPTPSQQLYQLQNHQPEASSSTPNISVRMPDIINEAEVLRRQQLQIEQEIKELEQQVGFFREIPNKPPPPYIPPANGSPLALLFPSEIRIDELIDGRVEELHRDRIAPEILHSDHVTNVYEKLILDMCKELYHDLRPADPTVSFRTIPHDKRPLVFHNPPDALRCMKDYLRVKIRRVLNDAQVALQQQQHQHQQHQLLLHHQLQQQHQQQHPHLPHTQLHHHHLLQHGHCTTTIPFLYGNGCATKRKPDQVDEILKQETHDDDARWTNFDREEIEVKDRITDELLKSLLAEALQDMGEAYDRKGKEESLIQRQESAM